MSWLPNQEVDWDGGGLTARQEGCQASVCSPRCFNICNTWWDIFLLCSWQLKWVFWMRQMVIFSCFVMSKQDIFHGTMVNFEACNKADIFSKTSRHVLSRYIKPCGFSCLNTTRQYACNYRNIKLKNKSEESWTWKIRNAKIQHIHGLQDGTFSIVILADWVIFVPLGLLFLKSLQYLALSALTFKIVLFPFVPLTALVSPITIKVWHTCILWLLYRNGVMFKHFKYASWNTNNNSLIIYVLKKFLCFQIKPPKAWKNNDSNTHTQPVHTNSCILSYCVYI